MSLEKTSRTRDSVEGVKPLNLKFRVSPLLVMSCSPFFEFSRGQTKEDQVLRKGNRCRKQKTTTIDSLDPVSLGRFSTDSGNWGSDWSVGPSWAHHLSWERLENRGVAPRHPSGGTDVGEQRGWEYGWRDEVKLDEMTHIKSTLF